MVMTMVKKAFWKFYRSANTGNYGSGTYFQVFLSSLGAHRTEKRIPLGINDLSIFQLGNKNVFHFYFGHFLAIKWAGTYGPWERSCVTHFLYRNNVL